MKFKSNKDISLSGIHTAVIIWCENENCNADQILWVSEYFEKPSYQQAIVQLYEIGWETFDVDDHVKFLCQSCATLYHEELRSVITQFKTVELGGLVQAAREDAERTNRE